VPCCRLEARSLSSALDHALWVGGAQGAGKSAAARAFALVDIDAYEEARDALDQRLVAPESEPAPETVQELRRDENLMVLDQIKRYLASDEGPAEPAKLFPLSCECTRLGCVDRVETGLSEYDQLV
jgi:hypothetical protein